MLLNSDTQVTAGWLDKLAAAAASAPDVATVTPFSNNATICSLPRFLAENTLPAGYDVDTLRRPRRAGRRASYPRLPTGVGVCLYVRRAALAPSAARRGAFGLGYGEEIDFCLRASAAGYRAPARRRHLHLARGQCSFGASRERRGCGAPSGACRRASRTIAPTIARFIRRRIRWRRRGRGWPPRCVRRIGHRLGGALEAGDAAAPHRPRRARLAALGARRHRALRAWLARRQAARDDVVVYARVTDPDRALGDAVEHSIRRRARPARRQQLHPARPAVPQRPALRRQRPRLRPLPRRGPARPRARAPPGRALRQPARRGARGAALPIVYQAAGLVAGVRARQPAATATASSVPGRSRCAAPAACRSPRCRPRRLPAPRCTSPAGAGSDGSSPHVDAADHGSRFIAESYARWRLLPRSTPVHVVPYGVPALPRRAAGAGPLGGRCASVSSAR